MPIPSDLYIGGLQIHLYSLFFAAGVLAGYFLARSYAVKKGFNENVFDTTALLMIVLGLVGARFFYAVGHWDHYGQNFVEIFKFWQGGLAFYGGLIGGALAAFLSWLIYRFKASNFLDSLALALPIGQALGRFGNFFNQEAFGGPTELPWGLYIDPLHRPEGYENFQNFHPTFFYESFGLVVIWLLLWRLKDKNLNPGLLFGIYAVTSGILRAGLETLRLDALSAGGLKISLVTAIVLVLMGSVLIGFKGKWKIV